jgi:hypothetical protein
VSELRGRKKSTSNYNFKHVLGYGFSFYFKINQDYLSLIGSYRDEASGSFADLIADLELSCILMLPFFPFLEMHSWMASCAELELN